MKNKVAACIVTCNRKDLLRVCLESIQNQTYLPDAIIIADNASTDGTFETLTKDGNYNFELLNESRDDAVLYKTVKEINDKAIDILYIKKNINDGSGGGFYTVMKEGYDLGYEWLWLMDDDGLADKNQLHHLINEAEKKYIDYANALVLDINDPNKFSFDLSFQGKNLTVEEAKSMSIIENSVNPWNGTLINRNIIKKIGLVKKEMFIWGEETEYQLRTQKNGFKIATIVTAIHYHKGTSSLNKISFMRWTIPDKRYDDIRFKYSIKNLGYNLSRYYSIKYIIKNLIVYLVIFVSNLKIKRAFYFIKYFSEGVLNRY